MHKSNYGHLLEKNWEILGKSLELGCFLLNDFDVQSNYGIKFPKFLGNFPKFPKPISQIFPFYFCCSCFHLRGWWGIICL